MSLTQLGIDEKLFKDYMDDVDGTNYINEAVFSNNAELLHGKRNVTITKRGEDKVDKYLRLYDKDGNVVSKDKAKERFKGNALVKIGDKFYYKIVYKYVSQIIENPFASTTNINWYLDDKFAGVSDNGLIPVLREYIKAPDRFELKYLVEGESYSESELKENKIKLSQVTGIRMSVLGQGIANNETVSFELPMMIPELDAKIENGKVIYIGVDEEKKELGNASEFFNLDDFNNKEISANNKVEGK